LANELSARTSCLRQRAIDSYSPRRAAERAEIYDRVYAETDGQPQVLRAARCLAAFLRQREIVISPEDLLAGHTQFYDYAYPAALGGWEAFLRERDVPPEPGSNLFGPPPYPPVGPRTTRYAYERAVGSAYEARPAAEAEVLEQFCRGVRIGLFFSWPGGHAIAGYDRLLEHGLGAYAAAAREHLAEAEGPARDFAEASLITCEAASDLSCGTPARPPLPATVKGMPGWLGSPRPAGGWRTTRLAPSSRPFNCSGSRTRSSPASKSRDLCRWAG